MCEAFSPINSFRLIGDWCWPSLHFSSPYKLPSHFPTVLLLPFDYVGYIVVVCPIIKLCLMWIKTVFRLTASLSGTREKHQVIFLCDSMILLIWRNSTFIEMVWDVCMRSEIECYSSRSLVRLCRSSQLLASWPDPLYPSTPIWPPISFSTWPLSPVQTNWLIFPWGTQTHFWITVSLVKSWC